MTSSAKIDVACAIIEKGGRVLAARRSESMLLPLKWEFPGGKIESWETASACLQREIQEELGIDIAVGTPLPRSDWRYTDFCITLHPFVCSVAGEAIHPVEHKEVRWVEPAHLHELDWAEADVSVVQSYRRYLACNETVGEDQESIPLGLGSRKKGKI